ncbi:uncharacterized protein B0I36DRAFT_339153 [Microdochium trichocladiopsis]|uniref:Uncharacterized protein n=1 Tax=Microdochium trichocladiopsis TaxID=1682393 RepID=A0A9P8XST5_9PEZI|nr:uncharacterized protein B0I36DRAFT_339153 [Microdochium trichocladiopsis]KAH7012431.1 hypothetical protein B0I36DRAFT_339153 [Microdochium trichocladiopsis]
MVTSAVISKDASSQGASLMKLPPKLRDQIWAIFYANICLPRVICHATGKATNAEPLDEHSDGYMSRPRRPKGTPVTTTITYDINAAPTMTCRSLYEEVWPVIWSNLQLHLTRNAHASDHHNLGIIPVELRNNIRHVFCGQDAARIIRKYLRQDDSYDPQSLLHYPVPLPAQVLDMVVDESRKAVEIYQNMTPQAKAEQWLTDPERGRSFDMLHAMLNEAKAKIKAEAKRGSTGISLDSDFEYPRQTFIDKLWPHTPGANWGHGDWAGSLIDPQGYKEQYEGPVPPTAVHLFTGGRNEVWKTIMRNMRACAMERRETLVDIATEHRKARREGLKKIAEIGERCSVMLEGEIRLATTLTSKVSEQWALDPAVEGGTMLLNIDPRA